MSLQILLKTSRIIHKPVVQYNYDIEHNNGDHYE